MRLQILAAAAALALCAGAAHASTIVLSDNFNADTPQLNSPGDSVFTSTSPANNSPSNASVDIIGSGTQGNFFDFFPGSNHGYYVDLDGTSGYGNLPDAGQLTSVQTVKAGTYNLTFDLAGNQRGAAPETTNVTLGSTNIASLSPASSQPFMSYSYTFKTDGGQLQFTDLGPSSQQGSLLDNVTLSAVPEPSTWALMILGIGGIGFMLRRSKKTTALQLTRMTPA